MANTFGGGIPFPFPPMSIPPPPPIKKSVALFWDLENAQIPSTISPLYAFSKLRSLALQYGVLMVSKAYADTMGLKEVIRRELQAGGCSLIDTPHCGRKEVADHMMLVDMSFYAADNPNSTIILITGDRDFCHIISTLRARGHHVVLVAHGKANTLLLNTADEVRNWTVEVLGMVPSAHSTTRSGSGGGGIGYQRSIAAVPYRHQSHSQSQSQSQSRPLPPPHYPAPLPTSSSSAPSYTTNYPPSAIPPSTHHAYPSFPSSSSSSSSHFPSTNTTIIRGGQLLPQQYSITFSSTATTTSSSSSHSAAPSSNHDRSTSNRGWVPPIPVVLPTWVVPTPTSTSTSQVTASGAGTGYKSLPARPAPTSTANSSTNANAIAGPSNSRNTSSTPLGIGSSTRSSSLSTTAQVKEKVVTPKKTTTTPTSPKKSSKRKAKELLDEELTQIQSQHQETKSRKSKGKGKEVIPTPPRPVSVPILVPVPMSAKRQRKLEREKAAEKEEKAQRKLDRQVQRILSPLKKKSATLPLPLTLPIPSTANSTTTPTPTSTSGKSTPPRRPTSTTTQPLLTRLSTKKKKSIVVETIVISSDSDLDDDDEEEESSDDEEEEIVMEITDLSRKSTPVDEVFASPRGVKRKLGEEEKLLDSEREAEREEVEVEVEVEVEAGEESIVPLPLEDAGAESMDLGSDSDQEEQEAAIQVLPPVVPSNEQPPRKKARTIEPEDEITPESGPILPPETAIIETETADIERKEVTPPVEVVVPPLSFGERITSIFRFRHSTPPCPPPSRSAPKSLPASTLVIPSLKTAKGEELNSRVGQGAELPSEPGAVNTVILPGSSLPTKPQLTTSGKAKAKANFSSLPPRPQVLSAKTPSERHTVSSSLPQKPQVSSTPSDLTTIPPVQSTSSSKKATFKAPLPPPPTKSTKSLFPWQIREMELQAKRDVIEAKWRVTQEEEARLGALKWAEEYQRARWEVERRAKSGKLAVLAEKERVAQELLERDTTDRQEEEMESVETVDQTPERRRSKSPRKSLTASHPTQFFSTQPIKLSFVAGRRVIQAVVTPRARLSYTARPKFVPASPSPSPSTSSPSSLLPPDATTSFHEASPSETGSDSASPPEPHDNSFSSDEYGPPASAQDLENRQTNFNQQRDDHTLSGHVPTSDLPGFEEDGWADYIEGFAGERKIHINFTSEPPLSDTESRFEVISSSDEESD